MKYLVEGEVVDTYGGDFTYRDAWYEIENGEYVFYEKYFGAKSSDTEIVTNEEKISDLIDLMSDDDMFEKLYSDYSKWYLDQTLEANNNYLTKFQIDFINGQTFTEMNSMIKENGKDYAIKFLKEIKQLEKERSDPNRPKPSYYP
jgi:hypothetical protein